MSRTLPLFPLDVALYPGTTIPLHIFEPRYRAMLTDIMAGDGRFGLLPPTEGEGPPVHGEIGCVARVVTSQPLADGRSNVLVEGERRFILRRLLEGTTPYLTGMVDEFDDEVGANELPTDAARELEGLADRCRHAMAILSDTGDEVEWSSDPALFTFQVAHVIPWAGEQGRSMLSIRTARERAALLLRLLPRIVPDLEKRAAVHRRAAGNGKGNHPPEQA